jgi:hypothetical protein
LSSARDERIIAMEYYFPHRNPTSGKISPQIDLYIVFSQPKQADVPGVKQLSVLFKKGEK